MSALNPMIRTRSSWGGIKKLGFTAELSYLGVFRHILTSPFNGRLNLGEIGLCLVFESIHLFSTYSTVDHERILRWSQQWISKKITHVTIGDYEIMAWEGKDTMDPILIGKWFDLVGWRFGCIWNPGRPGKRILPALLEDTFPGSASLGEVSSLGNIRSLVKRDIFTGLYSFEVWEV